MRLETRFQGAYQWYLIWDPVRHSDVSDPITGHTMNNSNPTFARPDSRPPTEVLLPCTL